MITALAMSLILSCDFKPVYGKRGNILYYNNQCEHVEGSGGFIKQPDKPSDPVRPEPPVQEESKPKGNASANNGKGGNYEKTGHEDNGKGKGNR